MGPEDEEQQKQQEGFIKKSAKEFQRKKEKKEKAKKAVKIFMKLPTPIKIALLVILLVPIIILLFAAFRSAIDDIDFERVRTAKADLFGAGATSSDIVSLNKDNGTWDISLSEGLKQKLTDAGVNTEGMSQDELITELLKLYGFDENDFSDKELQLMPYLLKAEIATQYVDLRSRDEMYDSSAKTYKTLSDSEIEEATKNNQILGTIHLKRVNTADLNNPIILEYVDYETVFKPIIDKQNPTEGDYNNIRNYFSINNEGNLVIVTWSYNKVTYTLEDGIIGNPYDSNTFANSENYTLSEMVIDYKPLVNKYTLPFEVLTALLINSEDVEFVEKVANLAFSANIEITIAEEATITDKTYTTNYYETIRNYQYISMYAPVNGNRTQITNYEFLHGDSSCDNEDDEIVDFHRLSIKGTELEDPENQFDCTYKDINFDENTPSYIVKQHVVLKDNTYKYGVTYADTWFIKAEKKIDKKETKEDLSEDGEPYEDTYKKDAETSSKQSNIPSDINKYYLEQYYNDNKAKVEEEARKQTEAQTDVQNQVHPIVTIPDITKPTNIRIEHNQQINQIIDGNGRILIGTFTKDFTTGLIVTTVSVSSNSLTLVDAGGNRYIYTKNTSGVWQFNGASSATEVDYNQTTIRYKRTDTQTSISGVKTKYELVEETPTQKLYDDKSEKFLKAYDESNRARGNISSSQSWLEDMLDDYDPNFTTIIMYLIDKYYGRDTSGYDVESVLAIYNLDEFREFSGSENSYEQFKRWLRAKEGHEGLSSDGTKYKVGLVQGHRTVGYGIDLETSGREAEIKALTGMTEIKEGDFIDVEIIDAIEEDCIQNAIKTVESNTNGLNLEQYQIYALASRVYNCGATGAFTERNGKKFVEAYSDYWKDTDDEYGKSESSDMYNHKLYTEYMSLPDNGGTLTNRRKSEWLLFKTGYFDSLGEYYVDSNRYSIEGINLYNTDGSVNKTEINRLNQILTKQVETRSGEYMSAPYNTLEYKQCTWWAYARASQYLGEPYPKQSNGLYGNGGEWYDINKRNNWFDYGTEPKANSIICWWNRSSPNYGHVAYVEAVDTVNKKIYISHAGGGTAWYGIKELDWNGYFDGAYPNGYIYLSSPKK